MRTFRVLLTTALPPASATSGWCKGVMTALSEAYAAIDIIC